MVVNAINASWLFLAALLGVRYAVRPPTSRAFRGQARLVALAVLLYPLFFDGSWLISIAREGSWAVRALGALAIAAIELGVAFPWLVAGSRSGSASARRVGLAILGVFLAGMLYSFVSDGQGAGGAARLVAAALGLSAVDARALEREVLEGVPARESRR